MLTCQTWVDDKDDRCGKIATHEVKSRENTPGLGLPMWRGYHCDEHTKSASKNYDHQGGCIVVMLTAHQSLAGSNE